MNTKLLFNHFKNLHENEKIQLSKSCYNNMTTTQRRDIFGYLEETYINNYCVHGKAVLKEIQKFREDSLNGTYYASFKINSKNYMDVPEETEMWFEKLAELLIEGSKLSRQADYADALNCFNALFECIDIMQSNEEIIFAHEYGMWMLPIREDLYLEAYIHSATALLDPEKYVEAILLLIQRDNSLRNKIFEKACSAANPQQKNLLIKNCD